MQFRKSENQSWIEVEEFVNDFWSASNEIDPLMVIDKWGRGFLEEVSKIKKNIEGMSDKEKKIQIESQLDSWLKNHPKPLIIDQIERFNKTHKVMQLSEKQISDIVANWDDDAIEKDMAEIRANPKMQEQIKSEIEEYEKMLKAKQK